MNDTSTEFMQSFDARDWARAFVARFSIAGEDDAEALMIGWFANALMRGFDEANLYKSAALVERVFGCAEDSGALGPVIRCKLAPSFGGRTGDTFALVDPRHIAKMLVLGYNPDAMTVGK